MAKMKRSIVTNDGQSLMAKLLAGEKVTFTKVVFSSQIYAEEQLQTLSSIAGIKQESLVSRITRTNANAVQVETSITNDELTSGYYLNTIGLYAKGADDVEVLYSATIAEEADYIPTYNGITSTGIFIKLITTVSNSVNVSINVDPSAVATIGDYNRLENSLTDLQGYVGYTEKGVLGLEADFENNKFTRLGDAEGRTPGASFDGFNMYGGRRRVNLADDGTVNAVFGDVGYVEDGSNGQVMVEQPAFYYKVVPLKTSPVKDGHGQNLMKARYYVSDQPRAGFKLHPAFKDHNGEIREKVYVSAYESSIFDSSEGVYLKLDEQIADPEVDKLSSIANVQPALVANLRRGGIRKLAGNRGDGWHQYTMVVAAMTQLLFAIEYASFNTQEHIGSGENNDAIGSSAGNTGATQELGNTSGSIDIGLRNYPTYRGEENLWGGERFAAVDGFTIEGNNQNDGWVALGDYKEDGINGSYKPIGFTIAKSNGYIKYFGYSEEIDFIFVPSATGDGANSSLPVGDTLAQHSKFMGFLIARLGGYPKEGVTSGFFNWTINSGSTGFGINSHVLGARLVYAP